MRNVWYIADQMITPLGLTSHNNYQQVLSGNSGIAPVRAAEFGNREFYGSVIRSIKASDDQSRFEILCIKVIKDLLLQHSPDPKSTLLIVSTTKGSVEYLKEQRSHSRLALHEGAKYIGHECGFGNTLVVSNACISGVLASMVAKQFIGSARYDHAVVVGADVLSEFIVSGFNSLMALSDQPCRPYDKDRNGISLGEGAGAILFSATPEVLGVKPKVELTGAGTSNDANHISGPSRTGKELVLAINRALTMASINAEDIDSISAHGTATIFNDEMEARAFNLAGLKQKPLYSLKGNFGHTLGAAGVIETIIAKHALDNNVILGTKGFFLNGVPVDVNISEKTTPGQQRRILKTASGFGGCNAAIILEKKV